MTEQERIELDLAAGLKPRDRGLRGSTLVVVAGAIVAGALACTAVVLSIIAFTRIEREQRGQHRQDNQASDAWAQRRRATYAACRELETTKSDARQLLRSYGIDPAKLPLRLDGRTHVFSAGDCDQVVEQRIPAATAPPGASLIYRPSRADRAAP